MEPTMVRIAFGTWAKEFKLYKTKASKQYDRGQTFEIRENGESGYACDFNERLILIEASECEGQIDRNLSGLYATTPVCVPEDYLAMILLSRLHSWGYPS